MTDGKRACGAWEGKSSPTLEGDSGQVPYWKLPGAVPWASDVLKIDGRSVTVKGLRHVSHTVRRPIRGGATTTAPLASRPDDERTVRAMPGMSRTLINNGGRGDSGYEKRMEITASVTASRSRVRPWSSRSLQPPGSGAAPDGITFWWRTPPGRSRASTSNWSARPREIRKLRKPARTRARRADAGENIGARSGEG